MRTNLPFIPNVRETSSECVFSRQPLAKRDVCTADILQLVNDGVHASGTGDEVRFASHGIEWACSMYKPNPL